MWQQTFLGATLKKQKHHPTIHTKKNQAQLSATNSIHPKKNPKNDSFVKHGRVENDLLVPADVRACL